MTAPDIIGLALAFIAIACMVAIRLNGRC